MSFLKEALKNLKLDLQPTAVEQAPEPIPYWKRAAQNIYPMDNAAPVFNTGASNPNLPALAQPPDALPVRQPVPLSERLKAFSLAPTVETAPTATAAPLANSTDWDLRKKLAEMDLGLAPKPAPVAGASQVLQPDNALPSEYNLGRPNGLPLITPSNTPPDSIAPPESNIAGVEALTPRQPIPYPSLAPTVEDAAKTFTPNAINANAPIVNGQPVSKSLPPSMTQSEINTINGKDYSKAQYDEQGNLIKAAGKDRDKHWSVKDKIGSTLLGALGGLAQGGLAGAVAGGITAGTDRNFMEKRADQQQLSKLYPKLEAERETAKYNGELQKQTLANQKTLGEIGKQDVETLNAKIKPLIDVFMSDKKVDETEAKILSQLSGLPYSPTVWQEYIDKEINGKTFTRSEYDPRYAVNETVPTDPTEVPRDFKIGNGNPIPMTPKQAAPIVAANEQSNANRKLDSAKFEATEKRLADQFGQSQAIEIMKYNFSENGKYQGNLQQFGKDKLNAQRAIAENTPLVNSYTQQIAQDEAFMRGVPGLSTKDKLLRQDEIKGVQDRLTANKTKLAEVQGKLDGANYFINNAVAPTAPEQLTAPKGSSGKTVSKAKVMQYAKEKGISFEDAKKHAAADGYTVK